MQVQKSTHKHAFQASAIYCATIGKELLQSLLLGEVPLFKVYPCCGMLRCEQLLECHLEVDWHMLIEWILHNCVLQAAHAYCQMSKPAATVIIIFCWMYIGLEGNPRRNHKGDACCLRIGDDNNMITK